METREALLRAFLKLHFINIEHKFKPVSSEEVESLRIKLRRHFRRRFVSLSHEFASVRVSLNQSAYNLTKI